MLHVLHEAHVNIGFGGKHRDLAELNKKYKNVVKLWHSWWLEVGPGRPHGHAVLSGQPVQWWAWLLQLAFQKGSLDAPKTMIL